MDFARIEQLVISHIEELFEWSEAFESKVFNPVDHSLWEDELWCKKPSDIQDVLKKIKERFEKAGTGLCRASGRNLAYIPNTGNYASCLAEIIRSYLDVKNSEVGRRIETVVIKWMCSEFGLSSEADGYMTSGGSSSSVIAVAAAREAMGVQAYKADSLVVYMTSMTHTCIDKALLVAGLGDVQVRFVELDELYRMDVQDLEQKVISDKKAGLKPFMVIGTVGTTDCGSIDPVEAMAKVTNAEGIWLHLDAAFGSMLAPEMKKKVPGFELCDSVIINGHKVLHQPHGSGTVLFNDIRHMDNLTKVDSPSHKCWSNPLENDAMSRGFQLWFSLGIFGVQNFRDIARRNLQLAQYAAAQLESCPGIVVLPVASFVVTFRCDDSTREESNDKTAALYSAIQQDNRVKLSTTSLAGYSYIRLAFTSFRTHVSVALFCMGVVVEKVKVVLGQEEIKVSNPPINLSWLYDVENKTKEKEKNLRVHHTRAILEDLHLHLCNPVQGVRSKAERSEDDFMRWLWPKEEVRSLEDMMDFLKDVPFVEVSRPECRYSGALGHFLGSVGSIFSGLRRDAPGAVELEQRILQQLGSRSGMSERSGGVLSSDVCTANILALLAGKADKLNNLMGSRRPVVYVSQQRRTHFLKPLVVLGLSKCVFRVVDSNASGGLDAEDLTRKVETDRKNPHVLPWIICEVNESNQILQSLVISNIAKKFGLWYHVEVPQMNAAELWSSESNSSLTGLSAVDSLSIEIGKDLCLPVGVAAVIVADHRKLRTALTVRREAQFLGEHLKDKHTYEPSSYSFELTRPCRVWPLWFTLSLLGTESLEP